MELPLISHPKRTDLARQHPPEQTTQAGDLLLEAHIKTVSKRAIMLFNGDSQGEITVRVAATMHDFGKAAPQFQEYVRPDETYDGPDSEKNHSRLGALAAWFVLDRLDVTERDRFAALLAVARHHQALPNAASYTAETLIEAFDGDAIRAQLDAIDEMWPDAADTFFELAVRDYEAPDISWEEFYDWASAAHIVEDLYELSTEQELVKRRSSTAHLPSRLYDRTVHYWASLTLADKSHAMALSEGELFGFETLDSATLEKYIGHLRMDPSDNNHESALNDDRERARRQAVRGTHEWLEKDEMRIATLTLPTGLGKTFTGLSVGFEARDILDSQDNIHSRPIVYALPYTSIIEQTREIFEDPDLWGADPTKSALTVHHYLSETVVVHDEHEESDVDDTDAEERASLLGESWRDGTILTTFVQLFESLTGPSNRQGLKLPALDSGIVILDEPQAIPKDWWDAIPRLLSTLTDEFDTRVVSMTATQPSVLRELDTISLLEAGLEHDCSNCGRCGQRNYVAMLKPATEAEYFDRAERVRYKFDETAFSHSITTERRYVGYDEAASRIRDRTNVGGSTLAVCNTIESSATLTETLCSASDVTHLGSAVRQELERNNIDAASPDQSPKALARNVLTAENFVPPSDETDAWSPPKDDSSFVLTFNSRYRPFDRRVLIHILIALSTAPVRFTCVSTQAIEAGVDVSFKTVFRDVAPLDSIVQAAGRCNRSYEWGCNGGKVIVWTLANPTENTPKAPTETPPAEYVYERGTTDAGTPGHLRLISDVLAEVGESEDIPDVAVSKHAVDTYFFKLGKKSLASTKIRDHIDTTEARWLARQSLIGDYETVDVLVAVTDADTDRLDEITDAFKVHNSKGYEKLEEATDLRVSLPIRTMENAPKIPRIDHRNRDEEGAQVFRYVAESGVDYGFDSGGLRGTDDVISGRFTVI